MTGLRLTSAPAAAILILYILFVVSAAASLFLGVKAQGNLCTISGHSFEDRIIPAFISQKLRENAGVGAVYTDDFGGSSALYIESSLNGVIYTDIIYGYDGQLYELFCKKGAHFTCADGIRLMALSQVTFSEPQTGLLHADITGSDGKTRALCVFLRSGGGI